MIGGFYSIAAGSELAKATVGENYCPRATCLYVLLLLLEEEIAAIVITTAGRPDSAARGWGDD